MASLLRSSAPLLLALAACGEVSVKHTFDDAQPATDAPAAADAPKPDAPIPTGLVTVQVFDDAGNKASGTPVLFLGPDGALVNDARTDATGQAGAMMQAGGSVTVLRPTGTVGAAPGGPTNLYSFLGVQPGDKLEVGTPQVPPPTNQVTIKLPSSTGVASYAIEAPCLQGSVGVSGTAPPVYSTLIPVGACTGIFVEGFDAMGVSQGTIYQGSLAVAGTVDLTGFRLQAPKSLAVKLSAIPPQVTDVAFGGYLVSAPFPRGFGYRSAFGLAISNGTTGTTLRMPDVATAALGSEINLQRTEGAQTVYGLEPNTPSFDHALGGVLAPWVAGTGVLDPDAHRVRWTELAAGTSPAQAMGATVILTGASQTYWTVVAPYHREELVLPTLVGALAPYAITPTATGFVQNVTLLSLPPGGWDVVRPIFFALNGPPLRLLADKLGTPSVTLVTSFGRGPRVAREGGLPAWLAPRAAPAR